MPRAPESRSPQLGSKKQKASEMIPLSSDEHARISQGEPPPGGKVIASLLVSTGTGETGSFPQQCSVPARTDGPDNAH